MSKKQDKVDNGIVAVKSKVSAHTIYDRCDNLTEFEIIHCSNFVLQFDADIIRFSINRNEPMSYEEFGKILGERHDIRADFLIFYIDTDGDLLPINNDNNLARALLAARCLLRIFIQRKGRIIRPCLYMYMYMCM